MRSIKKLIPIKVKSPISIFLKEFGKYPFRLVLDHVCCAYIQEGGKVSQKIRKRIYELVRENTLDYLDSKYGHIVSRMMGTYNPGRQPKEQMVWVFWWQGEKNAPSIVKKCIDSIRRNASKMQVQVIDATNYQKFVSIPNHIIQKRDKGIISFTHFSDYYRMALLAFRGGLWIDASVYMKNSLQSRVYDMPIYTIKNPDRENINISNWEWTVGVIGGWAGNSLFCTVELLLQEYWKNNDHIVDYYLFDYMIRLVVNRSIALQKEMSNIPVNNSDFMYLQSHLSDAANKYMKQYHAQQTVFYKVSWKSTYPLKTTTGEDTVYKQWLLEKDE